MLAEGLCTTAVPRLHLQHKTPEEESQIKECPFTAPRPPACNIAPSPQPWIWDASTGEVVSRLAAHRSPVLDVSLLQEGSSGAGLFAAVSQGDMKVYRTSLRR